MSRDQLNEIETDYYMEEAGQVIRTHVDDELKALASLLCFRADDFGYTEEYVCHLIRDSFKGMQRNKCSMTAGELARMRI